MWVTRPTNELVFNWIFLREGYETQLSKISRVWITVGDPLFYMWSCVQLSGFVGKMNHK